MSRSLIGKRYNALEVVSYLGNSRYHCRCIQCGKEYDVFTSNLASKKCDCQRTAYRKSKIENKYGYLTVVGYDPITQKWICFCKCGNTCQVQGNNLKSGNTTSCGCQYKESAHSRIVDGTNIYNLDCKLYKNSTTGHKGVWFNKAKQKYVASIYFKGENYHLGYFINIEDAIKARKNKEDELYNKFREEHPEVKNKIGGLPYGKKNR